MSGPSVPLRAFAPAKINLTLQITGRRSDGYHDLVSLVAFAAIGDTLTYQPDTPRLTLKVTGPFAPSAGPSADNLVLRAAHAFADIVQRPISGTFRLVKRLPVASGMGGGSSDAAAALRLLCQHHQLSLADHRLHAIAARLGADVPVCLTPTTRMMRGTGTDLGAAVALPRMPALLVNPGMSVATVPVFQALGLVAGQSHSGCAAFSPPKSKHRSDWINALAASGNDLTVPATRLAPVIATVIAELDALPGCRLARMSGSGATVWALFSSRDAARQAAIHLRQQQPHWWIKATTIG